MAINVAISGFGRIGRLVLRSIIENKRRDINIVAINDLAPVETNAFLLSYDSIHGPLKEKISINNLLIISDDLNLDFGKIRIKTKGTDGGHNGLKNISNVLGTNDYSRFRFGIGGNFPKGRQSDYVLSKWNNDEISEFISFETHFIELFKSYLFEGIDATMNKFNG